MNNNIIKNIQESQEKIINKSPILESNNYYIDYENKKIKYASNYNNFYDVFWCDFIETEYICYTCKSLKKCLNLFCQIPHLRLKSNSLKLGIFFNKSNHYYQNK